MRRKKKVGRPKGSGKKLKRKRRVGRPRKSSTIRRKKRMPPRVKTGKNKGQFRKRKK